MFISFCGIILILFSWDLYIVVVVDGMVGAGVFSVPTLGDGEVILCAPLGGAESLIIFYGDVCTTLGGETGLFRWDWNRVTSCLRAANWVSPRCENGASGLGCSDVFVKYAAAIEARSAEDINVVFVLCMNNCTVLPIRSAIVKFKYTLWYLQCSISGPMYHPFAPFGDQVLLASGFLLMTIFHPGGARSVLL